MGHSKALMNALKRTVETDWPGLSYSYDKALPGTRIRPDAAVFSGMSIIAAVEVGYTDARKLSMYREMGIPEIRWYDKSMRLVLREKSRTKPPFIKPKGPVGLAIPFMDLRTLPVALL